MWISTLKYVKLFWKIPKIYAITSCSGFTDVSFTEAPTCSLQTCNACCKLHFVVLLRTLYRLLRTLYRLTTWYHVFHFCACFVCSQLLSLYKCPLTLSCSIAVLSHHLLWYLLTCFRFVSFITQQWQWYLMDKWYKLLVFTLLV